MRSCFAVVGARQASGSSRRLREKHFTTRFDLHHPRPIDDCRHLQPSFSSTASCSLSTQRCTHSFFLATIIPLSSGSSLQKQTKSITPSLNSSCVRVNSHHIPARMLRLHELVEVVHVRSVLVICAVVSDANGTPSAPQP